jgi:outer membrane protein OmpA-like peptidoglycan-associated protein
MCHVLLGVVAGVVPLVAAPASWATNPFPISESFTHATLSSGWNMGGNASLTADEDGDGNGWLRLTDAANTQFGYVFDDNAFPSTSGVLVQFDYATWGGSGADGLTFFLYDGTTAAGSFHAGSAGGSLGYASCNGTPGLSNAYIGVGFDEYGNFTNLEGCGLDGTTAHPNYVSVRGSSASSYPLLTSVATNESLEADRTEARHVTISVTPDGKLSVYIKYPDGTFQTIATNYQLPVAPATLKFGYAASTGGSNNYHEIRNTEVVKPTDLTTTVTDGNVGHVRGSTMTWTAVVTNNGPNPTTGESVLATTGLQSLTNVSWTCSASSGASCGIASGSGLPNTAGGALPVNGTLTYSILGTPATGTDYAQLTVDAEPTGDTGDLNPSDDAASDTTDLTPVFDSNPTFTLSSGGLASVTPGTTRGGHIANTYQWQRCDSDGTNCVDIASATSATYSTTTADRGHTIRVGQIATNGASAQTAYATAYAGLPDTTIVSAPASLVNSTTAAFTFSTAKSGATFECQLNSGAWVACTSPKSYTGIAEGANTVAVRAVYGGLSDPTPATATWTTDSVAPGTTITSSPAAVTSATGGTIVFSGSDVGGSGVSSYECKLDAGAFSACTSAVLSGLSEGTHTFSVRAIDVAGNTDATPASVSWLVDTTNPDTSISSHPLANASSTSGTFAFSGSDAGSGVSLYQCRLDGISWSACTSSTVLSSLSQGSHTFEVRATDAAGNIDATPASYTWTVDTVAPNTTIATHPPTADGSSSTSFTFTGNDGSGSGVARLECQLDAGSWVTCTSAYALLGLADGPHTFGVRAVDNAGNSDATPALYSWTVDTGNPDTTINTSPPSFAGSANATFTFSGNAGTGTSIASYECSLDGAAFVACAAPNDLIGLSDGQHTLRVRAIDSALNVDPTPASFSWTVDTVSPETTIDTSPPPADSSTAPTFTFGATDPGGSGVASLECQLDGAAWTTCTSPQAPTGLADGAHTFLVRAIDDAGNVDATPASTTWTVDTQAPDTRIDTYPGAIDGSSSPAFGYSGDDGSGSGVVAYQCRLDGVAWAPCTLPFTLIGLADGAHTFDVRAIDAAGNADPTPATYTWTVDTTRPVAPAFPVSMPKSTTRTTLRYTPTGEPNATFRCSLDGGPVIDCTTGLTVGDLAKGKHTLVVQQVDAAGNASAPTTTTWHVTSPDGPAPTKLKTFVTTSAPMVEKTARLRVGCWFDRGPMKACAVKVFATVNGQRVVIGSGHRGADGARGHTVHVDLNATGRKLLRHALGGLAVQVETRATTKANAHLASTLTTRVYAHAPLVVPTIYFDTNLAVITPAASTQLRAVASEIRKASHVLCVGYTDSQGNITSNLELGMRRASAVCAQLRSLGVDARVATRTLGQDSSAATNATLQGRGLNRRVELHIIY